MASISVFFCVVTMVSDFRKNVYISIEFLTALVTNCLSFVFSFFICVIFIFCLGKFANQQIHRYSLLLYEKDFYILYLIPFEQQLVNAKPVGICSSFL